MGRQAGRRAASEGRIEPQEDAYHHQPTRRRHFSSPDTPHHLSVIIPVPYPPLDRSQPGISRHRSINALLFLSTVFVRFCFPSLALCRYFVLFRKGN